jgi:hypothetical protein
MKKTLIIAAVLMLSAGIAFADEPADSAAPFTVTATTGAYYDAFPLPSDAFAILAAIFNLRGGGGIDVGAKLGDGLTVGGEIGFQGMYVTVNGMTTYVTFDLPVRAVIDFDMGPGFSASAFGGILWTVFMGSGFDSSLYIDMGGRLNMGTFYLEASYEIPMGYYGFSPFYDSYSIGGGFFRFGMGSRLEVVR